MAVDIKDMAEREMAAYDALSPNLKRIFDNCPRKLSVLHVMSLKKVKAAVKLYGQDGVATLHRSGRLDLTMLPPPVIQSA